MAAAGLDRTYWISDWFMKKNCLIVYVREETHSIKRETHFLPEKVKLLIRRLSRYASIKRIDRNRF